MKHALVTGICGQSGAYLSKLLLEKGYRVYGLTKHRTPRTNLERLGIVDKVHILDGDLTDPYSVDSAVMVSQPDEIYNLAAQSHVGQSFKIPQETCNVNFTGYMNVVLSARRHAKAAKIYQASTSEMFGYAAYGSERQNEDTGFKPMSPYAISKVAAHWFGVNARYESDQFVSNGTLFNHESPLREIGFVTRKITNFVHKYSNGDSGILQLGNIDSKRDWGFAGDYVEAMWHMLQHDKPDDFVVATGETHTVREFVTAAFNAAGHDIWFEGTGIDEVGRVGKNIVMQISKEFYRPNDLSYLCGDATKIERVLGWKPTVKFEELVSMMVKEERT